METFTNTQSMALVNTLDTVAWNLGGAISLTRRGIYARSQMHQALRYLDAVATPLQIADPATLADVLAAAREVLDLAFALEQIVIAYEETTLATLAAYLVVEAESLVRRAALAGVETLTSGHRADLVIA